MRGIHATPDEHTKLETDEELENNTPSVPPKVQHRPLVSPKLSTPTKSKTRIKRITPTSGVRDSLPVTNVQLGQERDDVESTRFDQGQGRWTMDTKNFRGR